MRSDVPDFVPWAWTFAAAVAKITEGIEIAFSKDIDLGKLREDLRWLDGDGDA